MLAHEVPLNWKARGMSIPDTYAWPTAQMSEADTAAIPTREPWTAGPAVDHAVPFQCSMRMFPVDGSVPTAHTLFDANATTPERGPAPGADELVHVVPFQWTMYSTDVLEVGLTYCAVDPTAQQSDVESQDTPVNPEKSLDGSAAAT